MPELAMEWTADDQKQINKPQLHFRYFDSFDIHGRGQCIIWCISSPPSDPSRAEPVSRTGCTNFQGQMSNFHRVTKLMNKL